MYHQFYNHEHAVIDAEIPSHLGSILYLLWENGIYPDGIELPDGNCMELDEQKVELIIEM